VAARRARPPTQQGPSQCHDIAPQVDVSNDVVAFLKRCGLQMYAVQLLQHGFDELETLHSIEDADMRELGIPLYHAARLQKGLQELRPNEEGGDGVGEFNPVLAFLEEHGLGQYSTVLLDSGFDEMETLLEVEDADLRDLGLPRGHALKLKRHLGEFFTDLQVEEEPEQLAIKAKPAVVVQLAVKAQPAAVVPRLARSAAARAPPPAPAPRLEATETMKGDVVRSWEKCQALGTTAVGERIYKVFFGMLPEAMESFPLEVRLKYQELLSPEEESNLENSAALRNLFAKVVNAIGCTVAGLQESEKLVPRLTSLGMRHISYRVPEHYWPVLGKAMNITLRDLLGEGFTPEVENAWSMVYGFMSQIMIEGLRRAIAAAQETRSVDIHRSTSASTTSTDAWVGSA